MNLSEEKELVRQAQKIPDAFAKLYDQYYPKIFGYILRRTANLEAAQDITSETFFNFAGAISLFPRGCIKSLPTRLTSTSEKPNTKNLNHWKNFRNRVLNPHQLMTPKAS